MAYIRPIAFNIIEPRLGVKLGQESSGYNFGFISLLTYASILLLVFCFFYFSFEYFTLYYFSDILIKTIYSFFLSMILVSFYIIIFRPKIWHPVERCAIKQTILYNRPIYLYRVGNCIQTCSNATYGYKLFQQGKCSYYCKTICLSVKGPHIWPK